MTDPLAAHASPSDTTFSRDWKERSIAERRKFLAHFFKRWAQVASRTLKKKIKKIKIIYIYIYEQQQYGGKNSNKTEKIRKLASLTYLILQSNQTVRAQIASQLQSSAEWQRIGGEKKKKKKRTPEIHRFCASSLFTFKPRSNFDFRAPLTLFFGSRAHFISSG